MVEQPARRRAREGGHRSRRVNLRLSDAELVELTVAAARTGETPAGYAARVALAVARGELGGDRPGLARADIEEVREVAFELMQARSAIGRTGGLLNQAVTVLHSTGQAPAYLADAVQRCAEVVSRMDAATNRVIRLVEARQRHRGRTHT